MRESPSAPCIDAKPHWPCQSVVFVSSELGLVFSGCPMTASIPAFARLITRQTKPVNAQTNPLQAQLTPCQSLVRLQSYTGQRLVKAWSKPSQTPVTHRPKPGQSLCKRPAEALSNTSQIPVKAWSKSGHSPANAQSNPVKHCAVLQVDWAPTFDASQNEPTVLPAKVPLLLVNGTQVSMQLRGPKRVPSIANVWCRQQASIFSNLANVQPCFRPRCHPLLFNRAQVGLQGV